MISFSGGGRQIEAGTYTKLIRKGDFYPIMSDTPSEINDCRECLQMAQGNILINGLGLGWILDACLQKASVIYATVIEIDKELIDLVGPHYYAKYPKRLTIIHADALEYKPKKGTRFDMVWHDIWQDICADNLDEMKQLHRKYGKRTSWQGSWCRWECEHIRI